ncbi:MAG: hemerythrin domain-containing protein [Planctomycetota bacterium]
MSAIDSPLSRAFLEDHRKMTQCLSGLLEAIRNNEPERARELADELDRVAGSHIEFEEAVFYPTLERTLGPEDTRRLYHEHRVGLKAVTTLRDRPTEQPFSETEVAGLADDVQTALDHAVSCGMLLGNVSALDEADQAEMLHQLEAARQRGRRWSELHPTEDPAPESAPRETSTR